MNKQNNIIFIGVLSIVALFFLGIGNVKADSCESSKGKCINAGDSCDGKKYTSNIIDCDTGACCVPNNSTDNSDNSTGAFSSGGAASAQSATSVSGGAISSGQTLGSTGLLGQSSSATGAGGGWSLSSVSGFGLPSSSVGGIAGNIAYWLLGLLGILGVISFVISGILYLVSTGDDEMLKRAKSAMTWSFVGVIVGLIGVVVIQAIDLALRGVGGF